VARLGGDFFADAVLRRDVCHLAKIGDLHGVDLGFMRRGFSSGIFTEWA
jgi:hypothetical protein